LSLYASEKEEWDKGLPVKLTGYKGVTTPELHNRGNSILQIQPLMNEKIGSPFRHLITETSIIQKA